MTPRRPSQDQREIEILVNAGSNAHTAGVLGTLLRDRLEWAHATDENAKFAGTTRIELFADLADAAERFVVLAVRALDDLEPDARLSAGTIAQTAREMARASLTETLQMSVAHSPRSTARGGEFR